MAKITIAFGLILIVLGVAVFLATGSHAPTSLIPAFFGVVLGICGLLANTSNNKRRMLFMHIAVTVGLLGFLGTAKSIYDAFRLLSGAEVLRPVAVEEKAAMAVLMLAFVLLCVRSFIAARRARDL